VSVALLPRALDLVRVLAAAVRACGHRLVSTPRAHGPGCRCRSRGPSARSRSVRFTPMFHTSLPTTNGEA
jgi:hypothetical protein